MKVAVLADIHGNYIAFRKCVEYALNKGIEAFIFLGDYVGELAYPQETMEILYDLQEKYECYFVKGNKEDYWLNYEKMWKGIWKEMDSVTGSLYYTYHNLTEKDLVFFEGLSHKAEVRFESLPTLTICHGSPNKANEKLLPDNENTFSIMDGDKYSYILCGHTHIQGEIKHNGKKVFNAGAVGVSLHGEGKAQFMILMGTEGNWTHEFVSLDYDVDRVIEELRESRLYENAPCWCKVTEHLLRTGEVSHGTVLSRAMALCKEETGECNWPEVPEKYMERAVREMIGR